MQRFLADDLGVTSVHDTVRIVDPPAGVLEIDFLTLGTFREIGSGEERTMDALLCLAAKSRHQFVWPCLGQTLEDVLAGLEAAWDFFGGVFPVLIPDNLKAIVQKADAVNPTFNTTFLEYAQARGFEIDPARTGKPKDKARVERQVRYVRGDFFAGEDFRSVEAARIEAVRWAREDAGMRTHGTTRRQPIVAFEEQDKPALHPAPTEPYDVPRWSTHTVRRDHAVVVQRALYSVPYHLGRCVLRSRTTQSTVKLYLGPTLVKTHLRQPDGGTQIDPDDLPPEKAALATRDPSSLHEQAMRHGPHVGEYAKRLTDGPLPWSRLRFVYRLLGLARRFGSAATEEACARALEVDVVNIMTVERMLEKGLRRRGLLTASSPSMPFERGRAPLRASQGRVPYRRARCHRVTCRGIWSSR